LILFLVLLAEKLQNIDTIFVPITDISFQAQNETAANNQLRQSNYRKIKK
jgi:hypothetical protein